ncbi:MAG: hypothetical protein AAFX50_09675 [Acidobacteriota bacterium]
MALPRTELPHHDASTQWLLNQPAKLAAERMIRSTRRPAYFDKWDTFTAGVGEALDTSPDLTPFLGATLGAGMDLLFDRDLSAAGDSPPPELDLRRLGRSVERWVRPERALDWHAEAKTPAEPRLSQAVAAALALTTLGGLAGDLDGRWLPFWQEWVGRTVRAHVSSGGLDGSLRPSKKAHDAETLLPYLELAAATDMAALSIAGLVGYSGRSPELIEPLREVLPALSGLIRLAADMAFDDTEPVNCAVYLAAADRGLSLRRARLDLIDSPRRAVQVERRLIDLTRRDLERFLTLVEGRAPSIVALGRVVEKAVVTEIDVVRAGH